MQILNYGGMAADSINNLSNALAIRNDRKKAEERAQQTQLARQQAAELFKSNASPDEIAAFSLQNPSIAEDISKQIAFKNDATRQNMTESMREILINPNGTEDIIQARAKLVAEQGGDPTQTLAELERYRADPKAYNQMIEKSYATLDPQGYTAYKSTLPKQAEPMSEYQRASLGLQREKMNFDREMRKFDMEAKRAERELKQADTDLKRQKAQADLDAANAKSQEIKAQDQSKINEGIYTAKQNKQAISDLLSNDDYMSSISGYSGMSPTLTPSGKEAEAYLNNIKNSMTIENLGVMSGPLTDSDIKIIASASSRLEPGMSEKALRKELNIIDKAYDRVIKNYQKEANRKGYELESEQPSGQFNLSQEEIDLVGKWL